MQRKRRNINFGIFSKSPGKHQKQFTNSITNTTLHSIPTIRMSESNKKSYARIKSCPICSKDIYQPTSVVLWRSPDRIPFGAVIRTRASHIVMTPLSRIGRYLKLPLYIICTLLLSFVVNGVMNGSDGECYAAVNPTASLSVSNPTLSTTVAPGDTAYLSSNVTYSASDIDSYSLQVSYANGYSSLKLDGGTTTLAGANGTSGSSLANNSWGFAWTNNTTNNTSTNAGLTYYTVPTYGTSGSNLSTGRLENATLPESANNTLDSTTKRIVFAAKFAENNNNSGHYKTGVQLSMVATPRKLIGLENANTMQDLATHPEWCEETPLLDGQKYSAEYTLTDDRTYPSGVSKTYKVRKFADSTTDTKSGRCWMTENLRINNTTLKAASSDFSGSDIELRNSAKSDFTDANKLTYRSGLFSEANSGSTGYYNWYTATAGAGNSSVTTQNQNVNTSICPKGWTLPTGGSAGNPNTENTWSNFYKLFRNMGLTISNSSLSHSHNGYASWGTGDLATVQGDIYNFKYTGLVDGGSLGNGTSHGYWWSSTAYDANDAYRLYIDSGYVYPGTNATSRYRGYAVRCVMRDPDLSEITTMQEMTPRVCEKTPFISGQKYSEAYTLKDTRDGNTYTVRKFADSTTDPNSGRCWMTENLLLKGGRTLTPSDSDVTSNYNLAATLTSLMNTDFSGTNGYQYYIDQSYNASSANSGNTMYYSWTAATAGAGGTNSLTSGSVNTSICPKGWKLPTGGTSGDTEFYNLFNSIKNSSGASIYENDTLKTNTYTNWKSPAADNLAVVQSSTDSNSKVIYNFKYTGYVRNGSLNYGTSDGGWWSSTASSANGAYGLYISSSSVRPGTDNNYRYYGFAVRCIARDS